MPSSAAARLFAISLVCLLPPLSASETADIQTLTDRLRAVGAEGTGNEQAASAWRALVQSGPEALMPTLSAMKNASPIAVNWLRLAADTLADKAFASGQLSRDELERFVLTTSQNGVARRVAYNWLTRLDPAAPARLLPNMVNDPAAELRRDAIERLTEEAETLAKKGKQPEATAAFRRAFDLARDEDQVESLAKRLKTLDVEVDLATHYGFIRRWQLLASFDNTDNKGYDLPYPPEKGVRLSDRYAGKKDKQAQWTAFESEDPRGKVDLNVAIAKEKDAVAYAYTVIESPAEQKVELRAGSPNSLKMFVNGKPVFARDEYHHGTNLDQHVAVTTLKAGRNEILVKLCQNNQTEPWAQRWEFQLRLCDELGGAVPFRVLLEESKKNEVKK